MNNALLAIVSLLFMLFRSLQYPRKLKYSMITIVSPFTKISIKHKGSISIGKYCGCKENTEIKADNGSIIIGERCFINRNCMIVSHQSITIEDNTTIGPGTVIYDHDHDGKGGFRTKPIKIEENVWIGANCIILKGVTVGKNSVIGAGSLITKDVPPNVLVTQKRNTEYRPLS